MNAIAAEPGWRNLAIWALPPSPTPWPATPSSASSAPGPRPPPPPRYHLGRRRGHSAGPPRRPAPVAAAPGPGPRLHPVRVPRLGARGMPGRRRPSHPEAQAGPRTAPGEGDQDGPVPGSGDRTAWATRLDPAAPRRRDQRRPGAEVTRLLEPSGTRQRSAPGQPPDHALRQLARWVASQPEGNRNSGLFWAANRALGADPAADLNPLAAAARQVGLRAYLPRPGRPRGNHPAPRPRRRPHHQPAPARRHRRPLRRVVGQTRPRTGYRPATGTGIAPDIRLPVRRYRKKVALLVPAIASLLGPGNSFRMLRRTSLPRQISKAPSSDKRYPRCAVRGTPSAHVRIVPATELARRPGLEPLQM